MTEIEKTIEQLERVSKNLGCIGEDEDCTETAIWALEEVQKYRALENRLADMFGGSLTLEMVVDELEQQLKEPDSLHPVNARILTHKESAEWDAYRKIGTPEECRTAVPRKLIEGKYFCPKCHKLMPYPGYCGCGQRLY